MAIHIKPSKVGSLHKHLGVSKGQKIPASKLSIKSTDSPAIRKKKQFAINAKKWKHEEGGFITMPKEEFFEEHDRLLNVLKSPSRKDDKVEAKLQSKEVRKYLNSGGKLKKKKLDYPTFEFPPVNVYANGGRISTEETLNQDRINLVDNDARALTVGEEIGFGILDSILAPVSTFTGQSASGLMGVGGGKGSKFGQVESFVNNNIAKPILKAIPITKPFAEAADAIGKSVAPNLPNQEQNQITNPGLSFKNGGKMKMKYQHGGGLTEFNGPSHEQGGIEVNNSSEVEGNETMLNSENYVFSDSINVPGTDRTFASKSKSIKRKFNFRKTDKLSKEASEAELGRLMNQQETVKKAMAQDKLQEAISLDPSILQEMQGQEQQMQQEFVYGGDIWPPAYTEDLATTDMLNTLDNEPVPVFGGYKPQMIDVTLGNEDPMVRQAGVMLPDPNEVTPVNKDKRDIPNWFNVAASGLTTAGKEILNQTQQPPRLQRNLKLNRISKAPIIMAENQLADNMETLADTLAEYSPTTGNFIANYSSAASKGAKEGAKAIGEIATGIEQSNVQIGNQEEIGNQAVHAANQLATEQYLDRKRMNTVQTLDSINNAFQTYNTDMVKTRSQEDMLKWLLNTGNFKFQDNQLYMKTTAQDGTQSWVPYQ